MSLLCSLFFKLRKPSSTDCMASISLLISVPAAVLAPVCEYLLSTGEHRMDHHAPGAVLSVLNEGDPSLPSTYSALANAAPCAAGCSACSWLPWLQGTLLAWVHVLHQAPSCFSAGLFCVLLAPSLYCYVLLLHPSCRNTWGFDFRNTVLSTSG